MTPAKTLPAPMKQNPSQRLAGDYHGGANRRHGAGDDTPLLFQSERLLALFNGQAGRLPCIGAAFDMARDTALVQISAGKSITATCTRFLPERLTAYIALSAARITSSRLIGACW